MTRLEYATLAALAKPPRDADITLQRIPLENREYAAKLLVKANREVAERCTAKREREAAAAERARTTAALLSDITAGLLVWRTRDGLDLSDRQIAERANNLVASLQGNYEIKERP